jgi:hypothetical protein
VRGAWVPDGGLRIITRLTFIHSWSTKATTLQTPFLSPSISSHNEASPEHKASFHLYITTPLPTGSRVFGKALTTLPGSFQNESFSLCPQRKPFAVPHGSEIVDGGGLEGGRDGGFDNVL